MRVIAIIPARAGSKGILRKNLQKVGDWTLVEWAIYAAKACHLIDVIYVTSDSVEIRELAQKSKVKQIQRDDSKLSDDHATDLPVFQHALAKISSDGPSDLIVHLRPTCPLRQPKLIDRAIMEFSNHPDKDCLRSVSVPSDNPFKMWKEELEMNKPSVVKPFMFDGACDQPRQKLPPVWMGTPYVDIIRRGTIMDKNSMTGTNIMLYKEPQHRVIDIDNPIDLELTHELYVHHPEYFTGLSVPKKKRRPVQVDDDEEEY